MESNPRIDPRPFAVARSPDADLLAFGRLVVIRESVGGLVSRRPDNEIALGIWRSLPPPKMGGLEFPLAACLLSTVISPTWDEPGWPGGAATELGFFLGRDLEAALKIAVEYEEQAR